MRTVLCRLGHPAVHGAGLEKQRRVVLLVGNKGAGKSTLAAALQSNGWQLIADDLVRLRSDGGGWCALPGLQRSKLLPDSMAALGHVPETAERRWKGDMPAGVEPVSVAKLLLQTEAHVAPSASFPIAGVLCLGGRQQAASPRAARLQPRDGVLLFSQHVIGDPLPPYSPPAAAGVMLGELANHSLLWQISMPDELQRLQESAAWLDEFLEREVIGAHAQP